MINSFFSNKSIRCKVRSIKSTQDRHLEAFILKLSIFLFLQYIFIVWVWAYFLSSIYLNLNSPFLFQGKFLFSLMCLPNVFSSGLFLESHLKLKVFICFIHSYDFMDSECLQKYNRPFLITSDVLPKRSYISKFVIFLSEVLH